MEHKEAFFPLNTPIIFPVCTLNEGNGYDINTGKFTAPKGGVYMFIAHTCNKPGTHMVFAIVKGGVQLAISSTVENTASGCGSVHSITRVKRGEVVNVVAKWTGSHLLANEYRWNSFSGYLLYA
jgi:hypothetical protein